MIARPSKPRLRCVSLLLLVAMPGLSGCAAKLPKLPVCDGKHRRDANPYGTVLPGAPAKAPATPPPTIGPVQPDPPQSAPKTSAISPTSSYSSC